MYQDFAFYCTELEISTEAQQKSEINAQIIASGSYNDDQSIKKHTQKL